jgi:hypothetical protein
MPYPWRSRSDSVRRINMSSEPGNESFFCALRPIPRILSLPRRDYARSRFTHYYVYYVYIRDEVLGPIIIRMASFFPFHATFWLNGHSFIERELQRAGIGFHKNDNAFLTVGAVAALQAAADEKISFD